MKETLATAAARNLSDEDRDMLRRLALATGEDGPRAALDMGLREQLCTGMAEMADAVRSLLALLDRHDAVSHLPERALPAYQDVMERIGSAALRATDLVDRSRTIDRDTLLALAPAEARTTLQ